ncbi:hypothetical protein MHLP_02250 [Candidatus Mycoplasma haematolamae str. Purdue]|uniref:Uncharacterized protein n=1 Tax=Mycoplasma haematolamae (strain Purdue) TaxID=1212765 RepID=I7B9T9_MYCHA|nr:hypothetical protein MHLP_02250 [Candidatus Mycoplasma haematolamae str. Purdue]
MIFSRSSIKSSGVTFWGLSSWNLTTRVNLDLTSLKKEIKSLDSRPSSTWSLPKNELTVWLSCDLSKGSMLPLDL